MALRPIGVENARPPGLGAAAQPHIGAQEHPFPFLETLPLGEHRHAIGIAREIVELMGELMQHHVAPILRIGRPRRDIGPGQHHLPPRPALAEPHHLFLAHHIAITAHHARPKGPGIDQNRGELFIPKVTRQRDETGLRRNREPHLLADLQPVTADKRHLFEKERHPPFEHRPQILWQPRDQRHRREDRLPLIGAQPGLDQILPMPRLALSRPPERQPHQDRQGQQDQNNQRAQSIPKS